jgi:thiamine pyrophosphate-dependent acetolactate synthase large subunit-like protein
MKYEDCFRFLASRRTSELVVTSAGNSSKVWWHVTQDADATFYLDASMSLSTLFASGIALGVPDTKLWAFMGDGAFCMNPGMLMVERQMNLPNLTHFLVSNRHYGATSNWPLPNQKRNDYETIARGMGLERVFTFDSVEKLEAAFEPVLAPNVKGHTFVVLEVEPLTVPEQKKMKSPPFDGPDLKYRFGREVERISGRNVLGYRITERRPS